MSRRTGTYIAFDALGETDPIRSDFRYYATIRAWSKHKNINFNFTNSHEKTFAVRDTSKVETLESRIRERLSRSKNMIIILSPQTRRWGSMLSYEIQRAVYHDEIPLIITYTEYDVVANPLALSGFWPDILKKVIDEGKVKAIHIGFKRGPLLEAINQFNVMSSLGSSMFYPEIAYRFWKILSPPDAFRNKKKSSGYVPYLQSYL